MKQFALAAAALATVFSTSAMAAPSHGGQGDRGWQTRAEHRYDNRRQDDRRHDNWRNDGRSGQHAKRSWKKGERFDGRYARTYRQISQPWAYGLRNAPSGYRWVQSDNDAVLVAITTGIIAAVLANAIN